MGTASVSGPPCQGRRPARRPSSLPQPLSARYIVNSMRTGPRTRFAGTGAGIECVPRPFSRRLRWPRVPAPSTRVSSVSPLCWPFRPALTPSASISPTPPCSATWCSAPIWDSQSTEESQVNEVRFANGLYSYIYAIQSGRYFPDGDTDPSLVSYSITGHPLEDTWGAIRSSDEFWRHEYAVNPTAAVSRIDRIHDGFIVIPTGAFEGQFTVVYVQSPLHPVLRGMLTYTAYNIEVDYDTGERTRIYDSYSKPGFVVPTPEPGSVILFASGLAAIVMSRRRRRHP